MSPHSDGPIQKLISTRDQNVISGKIQTIFDTSTNLHRRWPHSPPEIGCIEIFAASLVRIAGRKK